MTHEPDQHDSQSQPDDEAPGWDAIDAALAPLYGDIVPAHFGGGLPFGLGGSNPLQGISAYRREEPVPHWHLVTYGLSDLYSKETDDPEWSGFGFELTMRLARAADEAEVPAWALNFLQNIARYTFSSGNVFRPGHWMSANGPIAAETDTALVTAGFVLDPELGVITSPFGKIEMLQVVGLRAEEEEVVKRWDPVAFLSAAEPVLPMAITDLSRGSLLDDAGVRAAVAEGIARDGSSTGALYTERLAWGGDPATATANSPLTIVIGAAQARVIADLLTGRLGHGRDLLLSNGEKAIRFVPGPDAVAGTDDEDMLEVHLSGATLAALAAAFGPVAGGHSVEGSPITWQIVPSQIRDADGTVVETIG